MYNGTELGPTLSLHETAMSWTVIYLLEIDISMSLLLVLYCLDSTIQEYIDIKYIYQKHHKLTKFF